jgi:hypothetical protein
LKGEEQNRNLLWSLPPICDFSAHFKFPTAVTHVDVQRTGADLSPPLSLEITA